MIGIAGSDGILAREKASIANLEGKELGANMSGLVAYVQFKLIKKCSITYICCHEP